MSKKKGKRRRVRKHTRVDNLKGVARMLRPLISDEIQAAYDSKEMEDWACPVLTLEELVERTGAVRTSEIARVIKLCHHSLKGGCKDAVMKKIPVVLVNAKLCDDLTDDEYLATEDLDIVQSWIAGRGKGTKAVGVLYCYAGDEAAEWIYEVQADMLRMVTNGLLGRTAANVTAGVQNKLLPDSNSAKHLTGHDGFPVLPGKKH